MFHKNIDMCWLERFARHVAVDMGAGAGFATAPMPMEFVRGAAIPGTVTQALEIGHAILDARAKRQNVVDRVVDDDRRDAVLHRQGRGRARELKAALRGARRG